MVEVGSSEIQSRNPKHVSSTRARSEFSFPVTRGNIFKIGPVSKEAQLLGSLLNQEEDTFLRGIDPRTSLFEAANRLLQCYHLFSSAYFDAVTASQQVVRRVQTMD